MSSTEGGEGVSAANHGSWTAFIKVGSPHQAVVLAIGIIINFYNLVFGFVLR